MAQPSNMLGYQSPNPAVPAYTEVRRKLFRAAMGNGVCCLILGMLGLLASFGGPSQGKSFLWILYLISGIYAFIFFGSGLIYVIGAVKIKAGSLSWHRNIIIAASIHSGIMAIWIALLLYVGLRGGNPPMVPIIISVAVVVALLQMIGMSSKSRKEIKMLQLNPPVAPVGRPMI